MVETWFKTWLKRSVSTMSGILAHIHTTKHQFHPLILKSFPLLLLKSGFTHSRKPFHI